MNVKHTAAVILILALGGCVASLPGVPVAPGQEFGTNYIQFTAPPSAGWRKIRESQSGIVFAKQGRAKNETFVALISVFGLPPTNSTKQFKTLIKAAAHQNIDTSRFEVLRESFQYFDRRGYPCVRYKTAAVDNNPQASVSSLLLQMYGIYCRHPYQPESGFSAIYSHRGKSSPPSFAAEARSFTEGVQVPKQ